MPEWLSVLSAISLIVSFLSAVAVAWDLLAGRPQKMWIMNIVWPITALYAGPLALFVYFKFGRSNAAPKKPFWQSVVVATTHCGAGCTLGDITSEWFLVAVPFAIAGEKIFGAWVLDYILAYVLGIVFQYFTIKPMKNLSRKEGLVAAVKADTLSLTAWQVGMYGWMAIVTFLIFGQELPKTSAVFWFMMQIAMLAGFLTSYPVNWWLVRKGLKESM